MEIGVFTFADVRHDPASGEPQGAERRLRELMEEVELAEAVGLDVFGVGEHHRPEFAVSTPAVVLAAAAARTSTIRLTSAVTVLSSDDPVRVFQEFSTVDLLSGGRAEIMVGPGSFVESFPLFGYDLREYDSLFAEKLDLHLDYDFNGEAYQTVSGQNSNNSVRIPNEFFRRVDAGEEWELRRRTDGELNRTVHAADLWDTIGHAA